MIKFLAGLVFGAISVVGTQVAEVEHRGCLDWPFSGDFELCLTPQEEG